MKLHILQDKLVEVARQQPLNDAVPYAFEKRIMANLPNLGREDSWSQWGMALWRAVTPYVAVMLLVGAWSYYHPDTTVANDSLDVALENTFYAPIIDTADTW